MCIRDSIGIMQFALDFEGHARGLDRLAEPNRLPHLLELAFQLREYVAKKPALRSFPRQAADLFGGLVEDRDVTPGIDLSLIHIYRMLRRYPSQSAFCTSSRVMSSGKGPVSSRPSS